MSEDDGFPNFASAYPTHATTPTTESASWNPALRTNAEDVAHVPANDTQAESLPEAEDDFFDRYPGATPKKQQAQPTMAVEEAPQADSAEEGGDAEETAPAKRANSISIEQVLDIRHDAATPEDLTKSPHSSTEVEEPIRRVVHEEDEGLAQADGSQDDDEEAPVFGGPEESAVKQEMELEASMPDEQLPAEQPEATEDAKEMEREEDVEQGDHALPHAAHGEVDAHPEQRYEHQGESLAMETAQDEGPDAPLLEDEEEMPTPGFVSQQPMLLPEAAPLVEPAPAVDDTAETGLDGEASPRHPPPKAHPAAPHIDRSFTTNFTDPPAEAMSQQAAHVEERPSTGDDETFGQLLGDAQPKSSLEEWPAAGGGEDFGELLGGQPAPEAQQMVDPETDAAAQGLGDVGAPDGTAESVPSGDGDDLAAAWQAALDDDELLDELDESNDLDSSNLFGDEGDDGLLQDEDFLAEPAQSAPVQQQQAPQQQRQPANVNQYRPSGAQQPNLSARPSPYAAPAPFITQQQQPQFQLGRSGGTPDTGLYDIYNSGSPPIQPAQQPQPPQRPGIQQAQSFADKSKGGYQSPYDLPMEVVKPTRRRPGQQQGSVQAPAPPPRSSSFGAQMPPQARPAQQPPSALSQSSPRPPSVSSSMSPSGSSQGVPGGPPNGVSSAKSTPKTDAGFFADLPVAPKLRSKASGVYTPMTGGVGVQSPAPPQGPPSRAGAPQQFAPQTPPVHAPPQAPPQASSQQHQPPAPAQYGNLGLRQPERMPLIPDQPPAPQQTQTRPPPATAASRYSPAPSAASATSSQPAGNSRYSPAPTAQSGQSQPAPRRNPSVGPPPMASTAHAFAPRTSSPLAFSLEKPHPPLPAESIRDVMSPPQLNGADPTPRAGLSPDRGGSAGRIAGGRYSPRPVEPADQSVTGEMYGAQPAVQAYASPPSAPPQRPRTQSPGATMKQQKYSALTQAERPTSAAGMYTPSMGIAQHTPAPTSTTQARGPVLPHRRQFSRELSFAPPQDERRQDPLERWKGGPIFRWSAGGSVLTSFPKQNAFYASGQAGPSIKCTPGDVKVQDASAVLPLSERDAKFPGPLTARAKGRKKEVLAWMAGKIEDLERNMEGAMMDFNMPVDLKKRAEERVVLWKIARLFVENDGTLEGNAKIDDDVRKIILPNLAQMGQVMELQSPVSASGSLQSEPVDRVVIAQLRQALLEGQRDRAVYLAEEKKLWGHAMLIASTMGPDVWKQVIQSFVRSQVKIAGGAEAKSLAAIYQVFAGNSEDCVDELVPPSARAGFQLVNRAESVGGVAAGNPLEGLDQWRETVGLVVSNRTPNDGPSLLALGKLLSGYGRVEAAHTCFLFARQFAKHSGADDAEANWVLLGANHQQSQQDANVAGNELDTILLTEIYEWASSLSAPSAAGAYLPHLQSYKLIHAQELAARGMKGKAQTYCDHITSAYQGTTRPSQYYHPVFTQAVADFAAFLSQSPQDSKGGLFSRPAMKTVSSGAASWFTKFVSGDDEAQGAGASGSGLPNESAGPFGRVSGEISRSGSSTDLYNPMMGGGTPAAAPGPTAGFMPSTAPQGRYGPAYGGVTAQKPLPDQFAGGGRYTPQLGSSPSESGQFISPQTLGVPPLEQQRPVSAPRSSSSRYAPTTAASSLGMQGGLGVPRPEASRAASDYGVPYASASRRGSAQDPGSQGSYEPMPSLAQEPSPYAYQPVGQVPQPNLGEAEDAFGSRPNGMGVPDHPSFDPESGDAQPATASGYEPTSSAYEPPSYQPYEPEPVAEEAQPKKRGMMDLDDDDDQISKQAAALKKAQADRQADEAFRKAAEADAARGDKQQGQNKAGGSWFGGWFKKDPSAELNKPIRAKLGEESSFYYDENLKKWVNKKGGTEASTPAAATPPPPRGPASRIASASTMGPPSGPPSRVSSGMGIAGMSNSRPPTSGSGMGYGAPSSGPPSRAGTPASNGPDGTGLLPAIGLNGDGAGPPSAPPSRPATGMSTASSLDDLLASGPRKGAGGTVKSKKKGGRYVDVMAK